MRSFLIYIFMTSQDIISYLESHPDFFQEHPHLLETLKFHHSHLKQAALLIAATLRA